LSAADTYICNIATTDGVDDFIENKFQALMMIPTA